MGFNSEKPATSNQLRMQSPSFATPGAASQGKSVVSPTKKGTGRRGVPHAKALAGKRATVKPAANF